MSTTTTTSIAYIAPPSKRVAELPNGFQKTANDETFETTFKSAEEALSAAFYDFDKNGAQVPRIGLDPSISPKAGNDDKEEQEDEDEEMKDVDAEDIRRQEERLAEGRRLAESGVVKPLDVPEDIAHIYDLNTVWIRRAWTRGHNHPELIKRVDFANRLIARSLPEKGRDEDSWRIKGAWRKYRFPGRELMSAVELLFVSTTKWHKEVKSSDPDKEQRDKFAINVGYSVLGLRSLLLTYNLRWRSIVPSPVMDVLASVLRDALELLDAEPRRVIHDYLYEEQALPNRSQDFLIEKAVPSVRYFFDSLSTGDHSAADESVNQLDSHAVELASLNKRLLLKADDHSLPIPWLKDIVESCRNSQQDVEDEKRRFASMCHHAGFRPIARGLCSQTFAEADLTEKEQKWIAEQRNRFFSPYEEATDLAEESKALVEDEQSQPRSSAPFANARPDGTVDGQDQPENAERSGTSSKDRSGDLQPPKWEEFPGPILNANGCTQFGKIVSVRKSGWGYRVLVNIGTESTRVLDCFRGCDFGSNTIKEWVANRPEMKTPVLKNGDLKRKPTHVASVSDVVVTTSNGLREPPTYFRVRWHSGMHGFEEAPSDEILTRSELTAVLGKKIIDGANGCKQKLLQERKRKLEWLEKCVAKQIHPDTGRPVTEGDKRDLHWIFNQVLEQQPSEKATKKRATPDANNIHVGDDWTPPETSLA
ncbi:hypothetical protein KC351_g9959 [Hortaea werneckii]|nr:hypothetical protein KC351_g9959 [Hortaea werneckii]